MPIDSHIQNLTLSPMATIAKSHMKSEVNKNPSESSEVKIDNFTGRRWQQLFSEQSFNSDILVY